MSAAVGTQRGVAWRSGLTHAFVIDEEEVLSLMIGPPERTAELIGVERILLRRRLSLK